MNREEIIQALEDSRRRIFELERLLKDTPENLVGKLVRVWNDDDAPQVIVLHAYHDGMFFCAEGESWKHGIALTAAEAGALVYKEPPRYDWSNVYAFVNWIATNKFGDIHGFEHRPHVVGIGWANHDGYDGVILKSGGKAEVSNWEQSLEARP